MNGLVALLAAVQHGGEAANPAEAESPAEILMHHVTDRQLPYLPHLDVGPLHLEPTWHWVFFVLAAVVVLVIIRLAVRSYRQHQPSGLGTAVELFVLFVRDEIADKNIGHDDGRKFTPLLLSFFFFILIAALLGLLPFSATSTGNISVTMGLAIVAFLAMQYAGISKYGVIHHFKNLIPPGLPVWLVPIMIPIEIIGMFARPFALMVRLFANMLAGHLLITTLLMLIPLMAGESRLMGVAIIPVALGMGLFIMFLELLVALIQAYVFTLLTAIFIGMFAHPAH